MTSSLGKAWGRRLEESENYLYWRRWKQTGTMAVWKWSIFDDVIYGRSLSSDKSTVHLWSLCWGRFKISHLRMTPLGTYGWGTTQYDIRWYLSNVTLTHFYFLLNLSQVATQYCQINPWGFTPLSHVIIFFLFICLLALLHDIIFDEICY